MGQQGFFDIVNRYAGSDAKNGPPVKTDEVVPWQACQPRLEAAGRKPAALAAGRIEFRGAQPTKSRR